MILTQLAECLGVIVSDGSITKSLNNYDYRVYICGNKTEDLDYFYYIRYSY